MRYDRTLIPATLIKRYKRFLADVTLENGENITVHCANTGAMTGCAEPGSKVWLYNSENLKRKYPHSWELVELPQENDFICINTARPNQIVEEALKDNRIEAVKEYQNVKREVKYGEGSRVDFYLSQSGLPDVYLEVKSVTLLTDGVGAFPDAVTLRGQKHIQELQSVVENGHRAVLLFCVLHSQIERVTVADSIDKKYGELLREAIGNGVEVLCYGSDISPTGLVVTHELPFFL